MTANRLKSSHANSGAHAILQDMRFYPDSLPPFRYEPTRDAFAIQPISDDCGEGVVALKQFRKGEIVFAFSGFYSDTVTLFTLQVKPGHYLHDPFFMGKVLHRCDPNCHVDMEKLLFVAARDIQPGDWVTMNYEQTEDQLFRPFVCNCGAKPCKGFEPHRIIRGRMLKEPTTVR